jgi:hypothetical protein
VIVDPEGNALVEFIEQPSEAEEITRLRSSHVAVQRRVLDRVKKGVASPGIRDELYRMATHGSFWRLRAEAIRILASKDSLGARSFIEGTLSDPVSGVRAAAVQGLAEIGSPESARALRALLAHERSYLVRSNIATALGRCGDASDIRTLRELAAERSHRNVVAHAARDALRALER